MVCECASLLCVTFHESSQLERTRGETVCRTSTESLPLPDIICGCVDARFFVCESSKCEAICDKTFSEGIEFLSVPESSVELGQHCFSKV